MKKIGFIGAGNMATAIIKGLMAQNDGKADFINIFDVSEEKCATMKNMGANVMTSADEIAKNSSIIVLAVKPQNYPEVLDSLKNSITTDCARLAESDANAIIAARIGVEHGVPARANTAPRSIGYKNTFRPLLCGISFIITGRSKSKIPTSFNPITSTRDARTSPKYPPANDTKTFPVNAQIIPITENTIAVPNTKNNICKNVFPLDLSFEYPPIYPTIKGIIAREQGDIDATTPPKNDNQNNNGRLPFCVNSST